ncbi:glutaminase A [Kribbella shirazensis]|uniref:Glutaminase n=1 Tax=Kribbella shirazensis TaxID=1105143 RepID=A0A7X5VAY5_9ACTN|nr:glutaminase A [Kribbella shirazensis]NIK57807.1 glutaminase [Kribbella shirazensis]
MEMSERILPPSRTPGKDSDDKIPVWVLLSALGRAGIQPDDPRVRAAMADVRAPDGRPVGIDSQPVELDHQQYAAIAHHGDGLIRRALNGELAVPPSEFRDLARGIEAIYADVLPNRDGQVADYIPTLRDADPERFGIAICTADGQTFSIGDADLGFSVQSTSKPFSYAMALEQLGSTEVHRWVGQEQSGGTFNDYRLSLGEGRRPHNPMINAGAMATLALVDHDKQTSDRFRTVRETWTRMMGRAPGFDQETYLAERATGDGNRGLASLMKAADMLKASGEDGAARTADFYFQVCSLEVDAQRLAAAGATLANGGVSPYSGERVFSQETAGRVLSVMGHSGMYNDSGKFSDQVGLPAKSGVSGNVMLVVPSKRLAVVTFSPRLDAAGNSVRGVEVCQRLVNDFGLHPYRGLGAERGRQLAGGLNAADRRGEAASAAYRAQAGMARPGTGGAVHGTDGERTTGTGARRAAQPGQQL